LKKLQANKSTGILAKKEKNVKGEIFMQNTDLQI